jgi:asparagine synthase (glutamine-hydrolysing)
MCGLTGFFHPDGFRTEEGEAIVVSMRDRLVHRGPDDAGVWLDGDAGIALGHRRLSILDLSTAGHQPMVSASGRFVLVFNGEIYNHQHLRRQLEATGYSSWRGNSDTETLLAAVAAWGLASALKAAVGMFALTLWDRQDRTLTLVRDRMGEKPLYYGWQNGVLLFGSELKALRAHPGFNGEIERDVLPLYLRHGYIPAPWSIYKDIRKLMPGSWLTFTASHRGEFPEPTPYWSLADVINKGQAEPFDGSDEEAVDALEQQLVKAIAGQQLADVPLGAFLSGGIDSSIVVALMQSQSMSPIKTFTIGFEETGYNEARHTKAVASHLGTDHAELYVTSRQAEDVIPQLPQMYDEPFGDSSAIPTHLVATLARRQVTVSLSGDGGDELLGGYTRYFRRQTEAWWRRAQKFPRCLRPATHLILRSPLLNMVDPMMSILGRLPRRPLSSRAGLIADFMECETYSAYYQRITSQWYPAPIQGRAHPLLYGLTEPQLNGIPDLVHRMMAQDSVIYLPDDILVKVDRAAMAVSLETRVPLLDHRVVELAWRMPYPLKVRDGNGKWLLKQVLYRHVPQQLVDRPKMGFGVPVDAWLRGPLRDWAEDLLASDRLKAEGYLDGKAIRRRWRAHLLAQENWRDSLWLVLMWQTFIHNHKGKT